MISLILAKASNDVVGDTTKPYGLPWHYPEDLAYYKENTINKINVMGHTTYKQIGKALPNRITYVLSRDNNLTLDDAKVINSIDEVIALDKEDIEIMICGGVKIFDQTINYANKIYLTRINKEYSGDVSINLDLTNFKLVSQTQGENQDLVFEIYERID